ALETPRHVVDRVATEAAQVAPRPLRNGVLGLLLGLVLGVALAFLRDELDTRVRTSDEVARVLELPLLARLAEPPRRLRGKTRLVTVERPHGPHAEAFRMLRTNFDCVNLDRGARMLMVTSALQGEGKSTTTANLAVALARSGKHVLLVDFDLRRPTIARFFDLEGKTGVSDVVLGQA